VTSLFLYTLNTLFSSVPLFVMAALKFAIPLKPARKIFSRILDGVATNWVGVNTIIQKMLTRTRLEVVGDNSLKSKDWYLVLANHQSWVDILVLQRIFYRKIPFLKFFIKKELIWFPILGQAWWALDFPFMKRYSKSFLEKHPQLKGKDVEITKRACEKFKTIPVSIMNFVEGTRFTALKHKIQQSPYKNLLRVKAGGIANVLAVMDQQIKKILDVTIVYPEGKPSFWSFLCGKIKTIKVKVKSMPVPEDLVGDYQEDAALRNRIHNWLNDLWAEKDELIDYSLLIADTK
jgi:1-acyl-sn-glycerol-3-phosphate acyltransferase